MPKESIKESTMKLYDKKRKSRTDLYDLVDKLDDVQTLTFFPFPAEYSLTCPESNRPETTTYFTVSSWGDFCHITVQLRPLEGAGNLLAARCELNIRVKDSERILHVCEEDILDIEQLKDYKGIVKKYKIGGFPFRSLPTFANSRIAFRGFLTDKKPIRKSLQPLIFWLSCSGKVFDNTVEVDAEFMKKQFKDKPIELEDSIEECIEFRGQIKLEESSEPKDLYLWGLFVKSYETVPVTLSHLFGWNHKGMNFHLIELENSSGKKHFYGHFNMGLGTYTPIKEVPKIQMDSPERILNCQFEINITPPRSKRTYKIDISAGDDGTALKLSEGLWAFPMKIKDYDAFGFYFRQNLQNSSISRDSLSPGLMKKLDPKPVIQVSYDCFFVSLDENQCQNESLTGGKGSSLAVLNAFSNNCSEKFKVPEAIVVTAKAYEDFLNSYHDLKKEVKGFQERILSANGDQEKIKAQCERIQQQFKVLELPETLKEALKKKLEDVFGKGFQDQEELKFAVRSSAVGEDSEEMSAAGQMTTFLGVTGLESICRSVIDCWSSQFSQTAVEYKRGYGQRLDSPMGVVVQRMVGSEVAGVMFTCSPLDGNQRLISISASYGLGESVVSGQVEPDTYTAEVDVDSEQWSVLRLREALVGSKKQAIHMNSQLTRTEQVTDDQRSARCLTDEQVLQLARIGREVHRHYGNSRDIEFGLVGGQWFLLQSRPVTNLEALTEWEVMHETDTGHLSENDLMSRANIGEVMPGASSYNLAAFVIRPWAPMTFAENCKMTGQSMSDFNAYVNVGFSSVYNTAFFSMKTQMGIMGRKKPDGGNAFIHGFEYALLGHKNENMELFEDIFEKLPDLKASLFVMLRIMKVFSANVFGAHKLNKKAYKLLGDYSLDIDPLSDSKTIYKKIFQEIPKTREAFLNHMRVTQVSMVHSASLYHFLVTKSGIKDEQEILDLFSRITAAVDDVFSAQVPRRLREISKDISDPEGFLRLSDEEAVVWLKKNNEKFRKFLEDYGHRGYKEFDLYAIQWEHNSIPLIHSLKSMLTTSDKDSEDSKDSEEEDKKTNKHFNLDDYPQLSFVQKKILRSFIIPKAHQGIRDRELGKNLLIRTYHQYRKAFYLLGEKLVQEGKLPVKELVFFMHNDELREVVEHESNPILILNAKTRLRLHPKKDAYRFDEETAGYETKPRNFAPKEMVLVGAKKLTGVPISSGKVVARACVAETLEEAKNIQKGDILITYSTDIGWSPYFAALSGLVTEIGGLVSHGAVIAREYGLPCLVGVDNATAHFKTGEMLVLDTASGFIAKVGAEDDNEKTGNGDDNINNNGVSNGVSNGLVH